MAGLQAGVVAAADINSQPSVTGGLSASAPAFWSYMWFILATLYLVGLYYGHIRIQRGGI